jgi:integrase
VEVSSGTAKRSLARKQLKRIEEVIEEHGQYPAPVVKPDPGEPTFLSAAIAHMRNGGERRYVAPLVKHFGQTLLRDMDQKAIDDAALAILPTGAPDYRNRAVYAPTITILRSALGDKCPSFKRPKGSKGRQKKDFMWPADAFGIITAADEIDPEFGLYLRLLLYTGIRKSEGLKALAADTKPEERAAWLRTSKNEDPRMLKLREDIVGPLAAHLDGHTAERLFKFNDGGHFKHMLMRAKLAFLGLPCPKRRPVGWKPPENRLAFVGFHTFRHTWATWMRRYGGADVQGLVETGNWRDPRSASRYSHAVARDEWDRVDNLPSMGNTRGKTDAA